MSDSESAARQPVNPVNQLVSKIGIFPVAFLSIIWTTLTYLIVVVASNSISTFKIGIVVTDYFSLLTPGVLLGLFYRPLVGGFQLVPFLLDLSVVLGVVGLSIFLYFHRRASKAIFFIIVGLFLLLSVLVLLILLQDCEGLGCIGQGFAIFFEFGVIFVAASILPVLWLSKKRPDTTKLTFSSGFVSGLPIFMGVILIGVLSISPLLVGRILEINKTSSAVEDAKSKIEIEDFPAFSDGSKVSRTYARGTTIVVQYSNGVQLEIGEAGSYKIYQSYQIARDVIEGRDKDKFASNPDYLLQERNIGDVVVTFYRSQLGHPQVVFISYQAFFSINSKDIKVEYDRNTSKEGFSEEQFFEVVESTARFYKQ